MGLVVFVVSTLSLLHVIGFSNGLIIPQLWDLINIRNDASFTSINLATSAQQIIIYFSEHPPPPLKERKFERYGLVPSSILVWILKSCCLASIYCREVLNIFEVGFL